MKKIEVFGSGCKKCQQTAERMVEVASQLGVAIELKKVTDPETIMKAGVMRTPAIAIEGQICHSGSVPDIETAKAMLIQG
jgi:small redox-active disulfide protein 2